MNEEQLADLLAEHLDALLSGKPLPGVPPAEIAGLLTLSEGLASLAPKAPPEFGLTLKGSLLGSNGSAPAVGGFMLGGGLLALVAVVGLGIVAALLLVVGGFAWRAEESSPSVLPSSTSVPVETETEQEEASPSPVLATVTPVPSLTWTPLPEPTVTITQTPISISPTLTPVVDVLPPITVTVRITVELPLPSSLVPGSGGSGSNSGGSSGGGGSTGGDHDRGHGNDPDGHDEDNPGRGDDDD